VNALSLFFELAIEPCGGFLRRPKATSEALFDILFRVRICDLGGEFRAYLKSLQL